MQKLCKSNEAEIGKKYSVQILITYSDWEVQTLKIRITMIYIYFKIEKTTWHIHTTSI